MDFCGDVPAVLDASNPCVHYLPQRKKSNRPRTVCFDTGFRKLSWGGISSVSTDVSDEEADQSFEARSNGGDEGGTSDLFDQAQRLPQSLPMINLPTAVDGEESPTSANGQSLEESPASANGDSGCLPRFDTIDDFEEPQQLHQPVPEPTQPPTQLVIWGIVCGPQLAGHRATMFSDQLSPLPTQPVSSPGACDSLESNCSSRRCSIRQKAHVDHQPQDCRLPDAPAKIETRVQKRLGNIKEIKRKAEYILYLKNVPKNQRTGKSPMTPPPEDIHNLPTRRWKKVILQWDKDLKQNVVLWGTDSVACKRFREWKRSLGQGEQDLEQNDWGVEDPTLTRLELVKSKLLGLPFSGGDERH